MKVVGFTFIRNAIRYDYPVQEAILSILPLCDTVIVAVGASEDGTRELIEQLAPGKIKILDTVWDDSLREGGQVLAAETNKALQAVEAEQADWAFYIQGDEVLHEQFIPVVQEAMEQNVSRQEVDGLLFQYQHFYGSYDFIGDSPKWYAHEIRIVKPGRKVYSYKDAQGFRKGINAKLNVVKIPASIYHYGWVKDPRAMQQKQLNFNKYWHSDEWVDHHVGKSEIFIYSDNIPLRKFTGTHPAVMRERIERLNWEFEYDSPKITVSLKDKVKIFLNKYLGWDLGYRNYRVIR
jgi:hypothetical protein